MWKCLQKILGKKELPKPVYTLADLPPNYRIVVNGLGLYKWVEEYKGVFIMSSETLNDCPFNTVSDAVYDVIQRYDRQQRHMKSNEWKMVK